MKRDIKYRAYNIEIQKTTEWSTIRKYRNFEKLMTLDHVVLMEYSGLKDKNGVEIYEGDIVKSSRATSWKNGEVRFSNGAFRVHAFLLIKLENIEVIGNIYENKELLDARRNKTKH